MATVRHPMASAVAPVSVLQTGHFDRSEPIYTRNVAPIDSQAPKPVPKTAEFALLGVPASCPIGASSDETASTTPSAKQSPTLLMITPVSSSEGEVSPLCKSDTASIRILSPGEVVTSGEYDLYYRRAEDGKILSPGEVSPSCDGELSCSSEGDVSPLCKSDTASIRILSPDLSIRNSPARPSLSAAFVPSREGSAFLFTNRNPTPFPKSRRPLKTASPKVVPSGLSLQVTRTRNEEVSCSTDSLSLAVAQIRIRCSAASQSEPKTRFERPLDASYVWSDDEDERPLDISAISEDGNRKKACELITKMNVNIATYNRGVVPYTPFPSGRGILSVLFAQRPAQRLLGRPITPLSLLRVPISSAEQRRIADQEKHLNRIQSARDLNPSRGL